MWNKLYIFYYILGCFALSVCDSQWRKIELMCFTKFVLIFLQYCEQYTFSINISDGPLLYIKEMLCHMVRLTLKLQCISMPGDDVTHLGCSPAMHSKAHDWQDTFICISFHQFAKMVSLMLNIYLYTASENLSLWTLYFM